MDNYAIIVKQNIEKLYMEFPDDLAGRLSAERKGDQFSFPAFGEPCVVSPKGIFLGGKVQSGVKGILLSLYSLHAALDQPVIRPFKAYKEFPDTAPYAGAFATHTENILVPKVAVIHRKKEMISETFDGGKTAVEKGGDFSLLLYPLPKIALHYIFYLEDEDFPPSVTCLYSNNAYRFMPADGLADVGEYTSRKILDIVS